MSYLHNFDRSAMINRMPVALTLDQVRKYAPSAFATQPHESRSSRYLYIPTVEVINAMLAKGFQVFSASQSRRSYRRQERVHEAYASIPAYGHGEPLTGGRYHSRGCHGEFP